jgi:hypothetical protein
VLEVARLRVLAVRFFEVAFFRLAAFLPPLLLAPGELEIFAARCLLMPLRLSASYFFSFLTLALVAMNACASNARASDFRGAPRGRGVPLALTADLLRARVFGHGRRMGRGAIALFALSAVAACRFTAPSAIAVGDAGFVEVGVKDAAAGVDAPLRDLGLTSEKDSAVAVEREEDSGGAADAIEPDAGAIPWLDPWLHRKRITLTSTAVRGAFRDFPVLISLTDADLARRAQPGGEDLVFTDSDAVTKLDHEIELWESTSGRVLAWVRVPVLTSSSSTMYLYYGNAAASDQSNKTGVWRSGFAAVMHLAEDPGPGNEGDIKDSTSNGFHGTAHESMSSSDLTGAMVGLGIDFDGDDDNVELSTDAGSTRALTVELWVRSSQLALQIPIDKLAGFGSAGWTVKLRADGAAWLRVGSENDQEDLRVAAGYQAGRWVHLACTVENNEAHLFRDGMLAGTLANLTNTTANGFIPLRLGRPSFVQTDEPFRGTLDEVRVSSVARTQEWIETTFENMRDPIGFRSVGPEESR